MSFNFPASPAVGQLHPLTPVAGLPQYKWDGEKWMVQGGASAGAVMVYVSDTPPVGAGDGTLWFESDTGLLYFRYRDVDSVQWVLASPQTSAVAAGAVTYNPQTVSTAQQTQAAANIAAVSSLPQALTGETLPATKGQRAQARENIYAAPFDSLAFSGIQVNGSIDISQEFGSTPTVGTAANVLDGWKMNGGGLLAAQVADAPPGLSASLKVTVTTAVPTLAAGDTKMIYNEIEGYRAQRLAWGTPYAKPISIGFWSKIHRPGAYSIGIGNKDVSRSYSALFTQIAADTWEFKTITIPGCTTGIWEASYLRGLYVMFSLAQGSNYVAPGANVWQSGAYYGAPGAVNGVAATTDTFQITGLIVLPGLELPSADRAPLIMRPVGQELPLCQRYLYAPGGVALTAFQRNAGDGYRIACGLWPVQMRTTPSVTALGQKNYTGSPTVAPSSAQGNSAFYEITFQPGNTTDILVVNTIKGDARL